eukprot:1561879-Prymnesium_polylepis.1
MPHAHAYTCTCVHAHAHACVCVRVCVPSFRVSRCVSVCCDPCGLVRDVGAARAPPLRAPPLSAQRTPITPPPPPPRRVAELEAAVQASRDELKAFKEAAHRKKTDDAMVQMHRAWSLAGG